ncbi:MAG: S8 family serine peptidase [Coleofasciculaceae cyanobacterium SM2_1_6]|nr:S8 family serine peptidase [Coleofasciculaceae cyanobacterium SM2_1_6]
MGTVTDPSGQLSVTWKFDGGAYEGQVGVVSTAGLENYDLNSIEFMQEALRRALDNIVVDDINEGAEFSGNMGDGDSNHGEFAGEKIVQLSVGEQFFFAVIPNGTFANVLDSLEAGELPTGSLRPLFSLAVANPDSMNHFVQVVDLTGKGSTFTLEDISNDQKSDWDLNDIIITVNGADLDAPTVGDLIDAGIMGQEPWWREGEIWKTIVESVVDTIAEEYDFPKEDQPLIGFIDTHLTQGNPDIDYSRIIFGKDWIENDSNPTVVAGEGTHADHILGIVAATQDNGLGIDGINDDAPLWVSSAVESGKWADALVEFVDAAIASDQPNAIINLSIDLTQVNPDGSVTTRYEFTPQERGAIEYARQSGVLIVAAAGNDGGVMSVLGQASQEFDNIITVGAADGMARAAYSSYGYGLDIMAPGGSIDNPILSNSGDGLGTMAGTSVATAQVTGAASQVWAANPELSYRQVIEILKETATDLNTPGWDEETGAGLLNITAAVGLAKTVTPINYEIPAILIPDTWSGEGRVTPNERAVAVPMWPNIEPSGFSGWVMATAGANVRSGPGTSFSRVGGYGYQANLQFSGWTYGERIDDVMLGTPDERWYRIAGTNNWVASALINGNAPGSTPLPPVQTPVQPGQPQPIVNVPINPSSDNYRKGSVNPFAYNWQGQCTWFAYGRMLETGLLPAGTKANGWFLGHAESWRRDAERAGLPISSTPTAGARGILVWPPYTKGTLQWGHVAFVEEVYPDGSVRISEANWAGKGISERTLTAAQYAGLSFVRLENATPNPQFESPQAIPGQQREYRVRSGDTLSAIAQRELGNANRWTEIKKADGSTFTAAEARNLQVGQSVYLPVNYQTGTGNPIVSPPSSTPINSDIRWVNFIGTVGPSIGVNLRNSTRFSDRSSRSEPNGKTLEFDAWTYGETGTDMWTGQPDARWFKVKGTNLWVPSAYIWGNPPNSSPMPGSSNNNSNGAVGAIGVVTIGVGSQPVLPANHNDYEKLVWAVYDGSTTNKFDEIGYRVDKVFNNSGFYALGLVPKLPDSGKVPVLVLRGTEPTDFNDLFADLNVFGVGYNQFQSNKSDVESWINSQSGKVDVTGHSLGGALAQWTTSAFSSKVRETVTFNSPGISINSVQSFKPNNETKITHYIVSGDLVSMAGVAFLPGKQVLISYKDENFWDSINPITEHLDSSKTGSKYVIDGSTNKVDNSETISDLSNPLFSYIDGNNHADPDYFAFLRTLAALSGLSGLASLIPGLQELAFQLVSFSWN